MLEEELQHKTSAKLTVRRCLYIVGLVASAFAINVRCGEAPTLAMTSGP